MCLYLVSSKRTEGDIEFLSVDVQNSHWHCQEAIAEVTVVQLDLLALDPTAFQVTIIKSGQNGEMHAELELMFDMNL